MDFNFIKDLPTDLKRIILNTLFLLPFWYLAIYLFDYDLIKTDLLSTFIISFCLSFIIQIFMFFPVSILTSVVFDGTNIKKFIPHILIELNSGFCIVLLCISIITSINEKFENLYNFVRQVFFNGLFLIVIIFTVILLFVIRKLIKARK